MVLTNLISGMGDQTIYEVGEVPDIPLSIYQSGTLTDPATVSLKMLTPDGVSTSYTYAGAQVLKTAAGVYHYPFTTTLQGRHAYTWTTTTPAGTCSGEFWVRGVSAP